MAMLAVVSLTLIACAGAELFVLRQTILQERAAKMRDMVEAAERLVAAVDAQVRSAGGTTEQAQQQAAAALRALRWGNDDYFGVYRWDGLTLVHGIAKNEGVNRINYVDPTGKRLVADIIDLAKAGGGSLSYLVPRASGGIALPKLTQVGSYPPWQWAIQAGVYVDDVNATLWARAYRLGAIALTILSVAGVAIAAVGRNIAKYQRQAKDAVAREAESMRQSEQRFRSLIQNASDVILICDRQGRIGYQSPAAETAWGYAEAALLDRRFLSLVHPAQSTAIEELWDRVRAAPGMTSDIELQLQDRSGAWHYVEVKLANLLHETSVGGVVVTAHDIEERKLFERQLEQQAFHDALTGLPNRALFHDRLDHALLRAGRKQSSVGLLFIDLDGFKLINDGLGHHVGDQLLVQVAARLQSSVRSEDTVARLGGDEFVIVLETISSRREIEPIAQHIVSEFERPFRLGDRDLIVTSSIGIAVSDVSQTDAETLLRNADVAMYCAKSGGKGRYATFNPSMHDDTLARLELESDLRRALERDELRVHYQPIVSMQSRRVAEVEALVRWQHPARGLIAPADFIPIAEETGLIIPLGHWVLEQACAQAALWHAQFPSDPLLVMSVNLSPRQFQNPDLTAQVTRTLEETGLPPRCLKLEITEGLIMRDVESTIAVMNRLKALGIKLAIDDFGTGYSSLSYLKRLPLDVLKIDRSFIQGIGEVQADTTVVRAIISLAKSLGLSVTGEGVESAEQAACLNSWDCDRGQGYHFGRPMEVEALTELMREDAVTRRTPVAA